MLAYFNRFYIQNTSHYTEDIIKSMVPLHNYYYMEMIISIIQGEKGKVHINPVFWTSEPYDFT